ncbi:MAG: MerR family transcriptional regulator [Planctomycetia bacterium]|nr:MerR family transcriptional regulator [Planctomycetia bacterium]
MKKFQPSTDKTPRYTVKDVAEIMNLTPYAVRYYDNSGLIPGIQRANANVRLFSDYSLSWLRLVHCLRTTGLSVEGVRHYINLCLQGDSTIPERAAMIFQQEKVLRDQIRELKKQMEVLKYKKAYYENLLLHSDDDTCNPATYQNEPNILQTAARKK